MQYPGSKSQCVESFEATSGWQYDRLRMRTQRHDWPRRSVRGNGHLPDAVISEVELQPNVPIHFHKYYRGLLEVYVGLSTSFRFGKLTEKNGTEPLRQVRDAPRQAHEHATRYLHEERQDELLRRFQAAGKSVREGYLADAFPPPLAQGQDTV